MSPYNARDHMIRLPGRKGGPPIDYLPVKERVHWLREEHPDAQIAAQVIELTDTRCVMLATVSIPGGGSATAIGSETKAGFPDYIEKADTVALGRALAILGYGIDFTDEFDEAREQGDPREYKSMEPAQEEKKPHSKANGWPENAITDEMPDKPAPQILAWFTGRLRAMKKLAWTPEQHEDSAKGLAITLKERGLKEKDRTAAYRYLCAVESGKDMTEQQLYLLQLNAHRVDLLQRCAAAQRER